MRTIAIALFAAAVLAGCSVEGDFSGELETVILPAEESAGFEHDPSRKDPLLLVVRLAAMR